MYILKGKKKPLAAVTWWLWWWHGKAWRGCEGLGPKLKGSTYVVWVVFVFMDAGKVIDNGFNSYKQC